MDDVLANVKEADVVVLFLGQSKPAFHMHKMGNVYTYVCACVLSRRCTS